MQALDRVIVMDAALRIQKRSKKEFGFTFRLAHQVHDELVYVLPNAVVTEAKQFLVEEMSRRPAWGPDLPLSAESGSGPNFADAK